MTQLTVSFVKGKKSESSVYHNNRKIEKNFDYSKKGHRHIRKEETKNNVQLINKNIDDVYDYYFTDAMKKYNAKNRKKHPERCFEAKTKEEKKSLLLMCQGLHDLKKMKKPIREKYLEKIKQTSPDFYEFCAKHQDMKLSELRHLASEIKKTKSYGRVMHEKMKHDQTTVAQVEFLMQVGNAGDFNVTDQQGFFLDKNSKRILDKDGKAVSKDSSSKEIDSITPYLVRKNPELWKQANTILKKSLKDFQKRNKNFVVYNAVVHNDEATPHLHFNCIPIANGYKRGLETRVSINKALDNEGYKISKEDNRKQFTAFQHTEANAIAQTMCAETGISRKAGVTNHIKNVHEYKKVQNAVSNKKVELENVQAQVNAYKSTFKKQRETFNSNENVLANQKKKFDLVNSQTEAKKKEKEIAETQRDQAIQARNKANNEYVNIQKQAQLLIQQQQKQQENFEKKLKQQKAKQEKVLKLREQAIAQREQQLDQREKYVESNENSFKKLFHQFKESYMLAGLQDLDDNFKKQNDIYMIASDWADVNSNSERAKNAEKAVFDNHPKRKIKAFLSAITSVFGRINNIDTALDAQQDVIDEQKAKCQTQQKQDIDIDDD